MENVPVSKDYGWDIVGWATHVDTTEKDFQDGTTGIECSGDMTLYGIWHRDVSFTYYDSASATSPTTSMREQHYYNTTSTVADTNSVDTYPLYTQSSYAWAPQGWGLVNFVGTISQQRVNPGIEATPSYYAIYTRNVRLSYNGNGATSGSVSNTTGTQTFNANNNAAKTLNLTLANNGFTRTGYTFNKWAAVSASGTPYDEGDSYPFPNTAWTSNASSTMYATWTANTNTEYHVCHYTKNLSGSAYTLYGNGCETKTGTTDTSVNFSSILKTIPGFSYYRGFIGTTLGSDTTIPSGAGETSAPIAGDGSLIVSLYYNRNTYDINYWSGEHQLGTQSCTYGDTVSLTAIDKLEPEPVIRNNKSWNFYGWALEPDKKERDYAPTASVTCVGNIDLLGIWQRDVNFTYYYLDGKEPADLQTNSTTMDTDTRTQAYYTSKTQQVVAAGVDSVNTYTLYDVNGSWSALGWAYNNTTTTKPSVTQTSSDQPVSVTPSATDEGANYYAVYNRSVKLQYNKNGGTGTMSNTTGTQYYNAGALKDEAIELTMTLASNGFTRTGYTFKNWLAGSASSGSEVGAGTDFTFPNITWDSGSSYTMYANWTAVDYVMQYTCSDGEEGYSYSSTAPASQTARYLQVAPIGQNAVLPAANSCSKIYGTQGSSDYCADCFTLTGWTVEAEMMALSPQESPLHTVGGTIPNWGKTHNVNWCRVGDINSDWGSTNIGLCGNGLNGTTFMLMPKYEPKSYTISYMYARSTGETGNRPGGYTYTMGAPISGADMTLANGKLDGWCKDDATLTNNCTDGTETSVGLRDYGNHTYYAKWSCDQGYELSYNENDEPVCSPISITCAAGYYLPEQSVQCAACLAGKYCLGGTWTYDGQAKGIDGNVNAGYYAVSGCKVATPSTSADYIDGGECAPCGANWTSDAGATTHNACYRNIVLNKNGMSGTLTLPSNSGCKSLAGTNGTTSDTLTIFYNKKCKLPTTVLSGTATGTTYTSTGSWATGRNASSGFVTSITTTSTSATITRYAGKKYTCAPSYYLAANTNGACSLCTDGNYCEGVTEVYYSNSDQGLSPCPAGYLVGGTGLSAQNQCKTSCGAGQCLPTATGQCQNVGAGNWSAGGLVAYGSTLACNVCPTGLTTIGYGAGADEECDCGRILHAGKDHMYLRSCAKTRPSLNVLIGQDMFYGNMSTGAKYMSDQIEHEFKTKYNGTTYSVYDDSASEVVGGIVDVGGGGNKE
jgi:uncharacterized repeat protein (TIGR02543 family)